jgi:UDP-glucose 4-epimerase
MSLRVLVTGASGFIGRALVEDLNAAGHRVRAAMRHPADIFPRGVEVVAVSDLTRPVDWRFLLKDIDTVVHLAGIAHANGDVAEATYDRVNRLATVELAAAARTAGIRHLIFMSSIRAQCGPSSDRVLTEADPPRPTDAYGRSKLAAEEAVRASGVPFTILRPVLVYGPGVKGNFARLVRLAQSPWPLPFASLTNRRSLLARENLIAAIHLALKQPSMRGETYIVADPEPLTLVEIITALRAGLGRPPRLVPMPAALLAWGFKLVGLGARWTRLGMDLRVSPGKLHHAGFCPVVSAAAALGALASTTAAEPAHAQR